MEMTKTIRVMVLLALASAGAGCGATDTAAPTDAEPQAASDEAIVHATLSLGGDHKLQFIEFRPGLVGVVDQGRLMIDAPALTPEVTDLPWLDLYRHFAGASAPISKGMAAASARALAAALESASAARRELGAESALPTSAVERELGTARTGDGPHFYNDAEQAWFNSAFCTASAKDCVQGWYFTTIVSFKKIGRATAYSFVGSEGTLVGNFREYYPDGYPSANCAPWSCHWNQFYNVIVAPGNYAGMTLSGGLSYYKWDLTGVDRNTQVSTVTYY
jgi:hypothetical protein